MALGSKDDDLPGARYPDAAPTSVLGAIVSIAAPSANDDSAQSP